MFLHYQFWSTNETKISSTCRMKWTIHYLCHITHSIPSPQHMYYSPRITYTHWTYLTIGDFNIDTQDAHTWILCFFKWICKECYTITEFYINTSSVVWVNLYNNTLMEARMLLCTPKNILLGYWWCPEQDKAPTRKMHLTREINVSYSTRKANLLFDRKRARKKWWSRQLNLKEM